MVAESGVGASDLSRKTEVQNLDAPVACEEHVLGLQIAVDDPLLVRCGEAVGDLDADLDRLARRHGAGCETLSKRFSFEQLRDRIRGAVVGADVVNRQDVRMRQRGDRLLRVRTARRSGSAPAAPAGS